MSGTCRTFRRGVGARRAWRAALLVLALGAPAAAVTAVEVAADGTLAERELFLVGPGLQTLALAHGLIDAASFELRVAGERWLVDRDMHLRPRSGQVVPLREWSTEGPVVAVVEYRFTPGLALPRVGLRPLTPPPVAPGQEPDAAVAPLPTWSLAETGDLDVRGSKAVYVSSGTRRDLTVDQNLRLNISGQLTRDIHVNATLSDDNLPVIPEGNTEQLQDIDKVLVELTAPLWRATLGDFVASRRGTRFGDYRRKLQGFTLAAEPGQGRVEALFGSPRGLYRTIELRGQEANQGPYFLGTGAVGRNLFIVAGSERVVMDGQVLTRGAERDYVIDYVRGTITFTYRRLVTADTLILVEYEEGEGPYGRTVVGAGGGAVFELAGAPASVGVRITREADDPGRLRTGELSDEDEAILAAAGADPLAAVAPGATQVQAGRGDYIRHEGPDGEWFEFVAAGGDWQVQFYYAGPGLGDYRQAQPTEAGARVFVHVGMGEGAYRVGRLLPLPESHSLVTVTTEVGDPLAAGAHAEWHLSSRDRNVLSSVDDELNDGQAAHVAARSGAVPLLGGQFDAQADWQWRDERFRPFLVAKTVQDYEGWGLGDRARRPGFLDQADSELAVTAGWRTAAPAAAGDELDLRLDVGRLDHGDDLSAARLGLGGHWRWQGGQGDHRWRRAQSRDQLDPLDIVRLDQAHRLSWRLGAVVPLVAWSSQRWDDAAVAGSAARGWRREEVTGGLGSAPGLDWRWELQFTRGLADSLYGDDWRLQRDSRTWQGSLGTPRVAGVHASADATLRQVKRPGGADETTRLGRLEVGGRWLKLGSDWNLSYLVDNSRAEVLARQLAYVGENQGRYDEAGNFVGDGRGDYELLLAGTDSLVATTSVRADLNWRQDFGFLGRDRLWGAWQSETRLGVEARSRTDAVGGLLRLRPASIFDEEFTVLGRVDLSEEITLLRHLRAWDLRYRFNFSEAMDRQYVQGRLDRLWRDHNTTLTWNPTATISLRLRAGFEDERRRTDATLNPTQLDFTTTTRRREGEGSWRPVAGSRVALAFEHVTREDEVSGVAQRELALRPSVRWRLARSWSAQAELRVADVASEEPPGSRRPFFFPWPGTNVDASSRVSWDPSRYLNVALAWFARKPGGRVWQHDVRLETTARF